MEKAFLTFELGKLTAEYLDSLAERNAHGLRLCEIANLCAVLAKEQVHKEAYTIFLAFALEFSKINREHEAAGYLTEELYSLREYYRGRLRKNICKYFGADALQRIKP